MGQSINSSSLETYIKEAITNIRDDRDITSTLLTKLFIEINNAGNALAHKELGLIASKYVETLQRSNEQLVKIASIISKRQGTAASLDEKDKKELFDIIQGTKK